MYQLISAIAKPLNSGGRWVDISLGEMLLPDVFARYARVLATLVNPYLPDPVCLDLADIRTEFGSRAISFNQFLVLQGNNTLQTVTTQLPVLNTRYARYNDAFRAGYKVRTIHPLAEVDADVPDAERTWLLLTKENVDYIKAYKHFLVSVNGFLHPTDASTDGLYVKHGDVSRQLSNKAEIGIYSFQDIGELTFVPITKEMVYKQAELQQYRDRAHVDLGMDVSNKTVMLVLGGYLHVLDTTSFYRVSDSAFAVAFANLPIVDRYYDSVNRIDLSSLKLSSSDANPSHISVQELLSDEALLAYMTLPQSFFVVLDNPNIFVETKVIHASNLPGTYSTAIAPRFPLISELGKLVNYWYRYEDGQFSITASNAFRDDYNYRSVSYRNVLGLGDNRNSDSPLANGDLRYLQVGTDL